MAKISPVDGLVTLSHHTMYSKYDMDGFMPTYESTIWQVWWSPASGITIENFIMLKTQNDL